MLTALQIAKSKEIVTLLDPAPAADSVPADLLAADVVCPNESEAAMLTGRPVDTPERALEAAQDLRARGAGNAVVTLGSNGAVYCDQTGHCQHVEAFPVTSVDSTAAGDAFAAALAVQLVTGVPMRDAVCFACAAGALASSRDGAQPSMPEFAEVEAVASQRRSGRLQ